MMNPRVIVYATIIQLAAFAIFDQGDGPVTEASFREIAAVSLSPMVAVALAHTFAEVLDHQIAHGNRFRWRDVGELVRPNLQFLYVGLAPIVIAIPFALTGATNDVVVNTVYAFGVASLFIWGFIAARGSGRPLRGQVLYALAYGILGLLVVGIELLLTH